jgi:hypothetical protein
MSHISWRSSRVDEIIHQPDPSWFVIGFVNSLRLECQTSGKRLFSCTLAHIHKHTQISPFGGRLIGQLRVCMLRVDVVNFTRSNNEHARRGPANTIILHTHAKFACSLDSKILQTVQYCTLFGPSSAVLYYYYTVLYCTVLVPFISSYSQANDADIPASILISQQKVF